MRQARKLVAVALLLAGVLSGEELLSAPSAVRQSALKQKDKHFKRDFIVNNHWIARGVTSFLCLGSVFCLLGLAYYAVEVRRLPAEWLVILGRTALMLYFLHHLLVLTLAKEYLGLKLNNWWWYALADAALLALLVGIGHLWLGIRSMAARRRLRPA